MRILIAGAANSIHMVKWARSLARFGHEVKIASFTSGIDESVDVERLPQFGLGKAGYLLAAPKLRAIVQAFAPDVVHAHYLTSYGFLCALAGIKPVVLTAMGSDLLVGAARSPLRRWFARRAVRHADYVTVRSAHMEAAACSLGADPTRLSVIPTGVDTQLFQPGARREPGRIISTRNFEPVYDLSTLIAAMAALVGKGVPFSAEIVGSGSLVQTLHDQAAQQIPDGRAAFTGKLSNQDVVTRLALAEIYVSTSRSDGNSVSLMEAMACGCFPVVTDIAANRPWIEHGVNGLLFQPGNMHDLANCLATVLDGQFDLVKIGQHNRENVQARADADKTTRDTIAIYENLCP